MTNERIKPELASGFKDYLPEEMIPRQKMLDSIRAVFESFGFVPLETPSIEREEVLTGGDEEFNKQIFRIARNSAEGEDSEESSGLALRFDLTVPLARVFAANSGLTRPFKRYQMGKVFRAEHAQMGRFREFMQCDADIVGANDTMADAEIISLLASCMRALGVDKFVIKIGSRKILEGIVAENSPKGSNPKTIIRSIDKLDKIGWDGISKELKNIEGLNLEAIKKDLEADILTGSLFTRYPDSKAIKEGEMELVEVLDNLQALNVPRENYKVDLSIARGLEYYTGIVYETLLEDMPAIGSVASGGRYDGLVARFAKDNVPAVGVSIGVDRLFTALEKLGFIKSVKSGAEALILNFDRSSREKVQKIGTMLRSFGVNTEIYLGPEDTFKGQLAFAVKGEYPLVVIIGPKEMVGGTIQVKDMVNREQFEVLEAGLIAKVGELLKKR